MNEPQSMDVLEGLEQLRGDPLQVPEREVGLLAALPVELRELVQIISEEFRDDDQVFLVVDVVDQPQAVDVIDVVDVGIYDLEQLDLIEGLVYKLLIILDDLHADHLTGMKVQALHCPRKCSRAQVIQHLVASCYDAVHLDREFLRLFEACTVPLVHDAESERVKDNPVALGREEGVAGGRVAVRWSLRAVSGLPGAGEHVRGRRLPLRHGAALHRPRGSLSSSRLRGAGALARLRGLAGATLASFIECGVQLHAGVGCRSSRVSIW
mmetsp:Transcript_68350/g.193686  ORF Transcript_68350/g.193686 Transcript_68350/m.193686 type:complete len:267 (-) Transcript_68350:911-1711(-)